MGPLAGKDIHISGRPFGLLSEMHILWSDFSDIGCLHLYCSKLQSLKVFQAALYHCGNISPIEKSRWATHFRLGRELGLWACLISKLDLGSGVCPWFWNNIIHFFLPRSRKADTVVSICVQLWYSGYIKSVHQIHFSLTGSVQHVLSCVSQVTNHFLIEILTLSLLSHVAYIYAHRQICIYLWKTASQFCVEKQHNKIKLACKN